MMRTCHRYLLTAACVAVLSGPAIAEPAPKKAPPPKTKSNLLDLLGAGDMAGAARDLRKASEAFERFGNTMKAIIPSVTQGLVEGSRNVASMGHAFDPLGLKTALTIIREQNQTIHALQRAEIKRLEAECQRLRNQLKQRPGKAKNRKKGRK